MLLKKIILLMVFCPVAGFANVSIQEQLIELRAKVQSEADQLDVEKKSINASIQSLTVEKGELESQRKLLLQANTQYKKTLIEKNKIMGGEELKESKGFVEIVNSGVESLSSYFNDAVPFKVTERKKRLEKIKTLFDKKELTASEYFEKYWSILQDEIRLSENVEIQNDTILIEGLEHKVKVLKLGMVELYFKSLDGRIGHAVKKDSLWTFEFFKKSNFSKNVELLFAAKEKQIKGGRYNLPFRVSSEVKDVL